MLLVIFVIGLALLFWGLHLYHARKNGDDEPGIIRSIIGGITALVSIIGALVMFIEINNIDRIDGLRLAYLRENNIEIEERVQKAIADYQAYEKETYADHKPTIGSDITVAVSMYPQLKSDTMVQALLETYINNNAEIRQITLNGILARPNKSYWLCFGLWGPPAPTPAQ